MDAARRAIALPAMHVQLEKYEVVPNHIQEKIVADVKVAAAAN